jgi:hypothetical protein
MIISFKIFEKKENFDQYKDKFFLYNSRYSQDELYYIVLVDYIEKYKYQLPMNYYATPHGDCFSVMKDGRIANPGGWGKSLSKHEFENVDFMTSDEFYKKHPDICVKLYLKIIREYSVNTTGYATWYYKTLERYKTILETIKDLDELIAISKYNL